ncbi:MAG TPA: cardiolipin synthase [Peptococcaceae bacterium]|nr:cardiolipin synthase [Peptococcaceae bacterium]HPZ71867.1 cardiolipin synthase [Peptococcaceae bacterium]HQD54207.1 cardiolipin synthase [Peptococcaceae bacterium]
MKKKEFFLGLVVVLVLFTCYYYLSQLYLKAMELPSSLDQNYPYFKDLFYLIFFSLLLFAGLLIILEGRDPSKTLAWLMVLIFLPIAGFALYLIFGRQFRKKRITAKKRRLNDHLNYPLQDSPPMAGQNPKGLPPELHIAKEKERLMQLILNNATFPPTINNEVKVLKNGKEIFPAFLQAMEEAQKYIYLETYIFRNDRLGTTIGTLLCVKARSGVKVRVLCDALGSRHLSKQFIAKLRDAGVEIEPFLPINRWPFHRKINYRNHRKILVVDGKIGFIGGANIGDEYLGRHPKIGPWRDTQLQLQGNAVRFLERVFLQDWSFTTKKPMELNEEPLFSEQPDTGNRIVQIMASGPDTQWEAIMQVYYYTIATAEKSVFITSPYFIPNESILTALKTTALSGVDVKLLLPAKPDYKIVYWATMSYLEELLAAGVEIYFYRKGFIHAKVLVVDGILSSIGSANMDLRSFSLNFEVNALIYDKETATRLQNDFLTDLQYAKKLEPAEFQERPLRHRFAESLARLFSPLL